MDKTGCTHYSASYGGCNVFGKGSCRSVCLSFKERKLYMLFSLRIVLDQILWSSTSPSYVDCDWWKSFSMLGHHGWRLRQDNPHWCPCWIAEAACQIEIWPPFYCHICHSGCRKVFRVFLHPQHLCIYGRNFPIQILYTKQPAIDYLDEVVWHLFF